VREIMTPASFLKELFSREKDTNVDPGLPSLLKIQITSVLLTTLSKTLVETTATGTQPANTISDVEIMTILTLLLLETAANAVVDISVHPRLSLMPLETAVVGTEIIQINAVITTTLALLLLKTVANAVVE
jgi:AAA15 family ATPase/GTPase